MGGVGPGAQARSRHAGCPGSITALRVDYARNTSAFEPQEGETEVAARRTDLKQWKAGYRLSAKPQWNSSVDHPAVKFPDRAKMRLLSAYQAINEEPDYRSPQLASVYKDSVFIPKHSKFEVDPHSFLSSEERSRLVTKNVIPGRTAVYHDTAAAAAEGGGGAWNISVELGKERSGLHHNKEYADCRLVNKLRVSPHSYQPPQKQAQRLNDSIRADKLAAQQREAAAQAELHRTPLTMKNKELWMGLDPVKVALGEQTTT